MQGCWFFYIIWDVIDVTNINNVTVEVVTMIDSSLYAWVQSSERTMGLCKSVTNQSQAQSTTIPVTSYLVSQTGDRLSHLKNQFAYAELCYITH